MKERLENLLKNAYAPMTHFPVAAVVVTKDGRMFDGVNVEDATTRAGSCAERTAMFSMISAGYKKGDIKEINFMLGSGKIGSPCFVCRQMMVELCDKNTIIKSYAKNGEVKVYTLDELCPYTFSQEDLI